MNQVDIHNLLKQVDWLLEQLVQNLNLAIHLDNTGSSLLLLCCWLTLN
jgi:predicted lysophospholipase L1 biosynthesis ABC-type transport system permease subunit